MSAVDKYRACAEAGMSQGEAARTLGVSREAVRLMANKHSLPFPPTVFQRAAWLKAEIREADRDTNTIHDLAAKLGCKPYTIRGLGGTGFKKKARVPKRLAAIQELAAQGYTVTETAELLGMKQSNVSMLKTRFNIVFLRSGRYAGPREPRENP